MFKNKEKIKNILIVLIAVLVVLQFLITKQMDFPSILGDRNISALDIWSFQHLIVGFLLGFLVVRYWPKMAKNWQSMVFVMFFLAVGWEIIELLLEYGEVNLILVYWKDHEHWVNRLISDPIMNTTGGLIIYKINKLLE